MKKIVLVAAISIALLTRCTDDSGAKRAAEGMGFTNVEITGYRMWGCGRDDSFSTGFRAKNVRGETVTGIVCSGWLKGSTVRLD